MSQIAQLSSLSYLPVSAQSVVGNPTNTASIGTSITGDPGQVLRLNDTGALGFGAIDLSTAAAVSGILAVPNGGIGTGSLDAFGVVIGNDTAAVSVATPGDAGTVLISTGTGSAPAFSQISFTSSVTGVLGVDFGGTGRNTLDVFAIMAGNGADAVTAIVNGTTGVPLLSTGTTLPAFGALDLSNTAAITGQLSSAYITGTLIIEPTIAGRVLASQGTGSYPAFSASVQLATALAIGPITTTPTTSASLDINQNATSPGLAVTGTLVRILSADNAATYLEMRNYSSAAPATGINGIAIGGTGAAPAVTPNVSVAAALYGYGYNGSALANGGAIQVLTTQAWSTTAQGMAVRIFATPANSTTLLLAAQFQSGVAIGTTTLAGGQGSLLATTGTFVSGVISPRVIGSTGAGGVLSLQSTSTSGAPGDAVQIVSGNGSTFAYFNATGLGLGNVTAGGVATLDINKNTTSPALVSAATMLRILGGNDVNSVIETRTYSTASPTNILYTVAIGGTAVSPAVTPNLSFPMLIDNYGYDGSSLALGSRIAAITTEAWNTTSHGSRIRISATPTGTTTMVATVAQFQGGFSLGTTGDPGTGYSLQTGGARIFSGTAPPTNGSSTFGYRMGNNNTGFGLFGGTGAPTFTAGMNSIYLRTDGNTTTTRIYVNISGTATWTGVLTQA